MRFYTSCYDLPIGRFIRCVCDNDLTALVIEGEPNNELLVEAWQKIYQEYTELSGSQKDNYRLMLTMEVDRLYFRYVFATEAVSVLRKCRFDDLVKMLKANGYNFQFNPADPEGYHKDLDRVLNRAKALLVERTQKQKELDALKQAQGTGKATRQAYDMELTTLSKFVGYHINVDQTTVSRYIHILNQYIKHVDHLKTQHGRGQNK